MQLEKKFGTQVQSFFQMSKIQWILMLSPIKHPISKCKKLMVDMFEEQARIVHQKSDLELLCDIKIFLKSYMHFATICVRLPLERKVKCLHMCAFECLKNLHKAAMFSFFILCTLLNFNKVTCSFSFAM